MSELIAKAATPDAERQKARELQGRAEEMELEELDACIKEYGIKSPEGNEFGPSYNMNLMFATQLGPVDGSTAYVIDRRSIALSILSSTLLSPVSLYVYADACVCVYGRVLKIPLSLIAARMPWYSRN